MKNLLLTALAMLGLTAATLAQNIPNYVPTNGLVGWWPFNGNANDENGNNLNGVVNNAALTTDRFANNNSAYVFSTGNIEIPNTFTFSNATGLTLSGWIQYNNIVNNPLANTMIDFSDGTCDNCWLHRYALGQGNGGIFFLREGNAIGSISGIMNVVAPPAGNWVHVVGTINTNNSIVALYINGQLIQSISFTGPYDLSLNYTGTNSRIFGARTVTTYQNLLNGKLDDIGIWNRALTQQEITALYNAANCSNNTTITPPTNTLNTGSLATFNASTSDPNPSYVWQSDFGQGFMTLSDYGNYSGTNTIALNISNVQLPNHTQPVRVITTSGNCIDTSNVAIITIADTCFNTITDTTFITVTDTLVINTTITSLNPPYNANTIMVFPNPTNDHITIDYGNFNVMNGYQLKIENSLGQQVFQTSITQQSDYLNLTTWGGNGLYFVHIIDPQGNTIDIRKIVLQ